MAYGWWGDFADSPSEGKTARIGRPKRDRAKVKAARKAGRR